MSILLSLVLVLDVGSAVSARESERQFDFDLPPQPVLSALMEFAEQADLTLVFPDDVVRDKSANALTGSYTLQQGVDILLAGTGLTPTFSNETVLSISADDRLTNEGNAMKKNAMQKRAPLLERLTVALTGILWGAGALAADGGVSQSATQSEGQTEEQIEEIVVTATHHETNLMKTPMAISVLSDEDIVERGITNISDLYTFVPGLSYQSRDGGENTISIRGLTPPTLLGASMVAIYIDDTPVTARPPGTFGTGSNQGQISGNLLDIERIEVLKGPQGTLYGENAMGGAIRYITKKADANNLDWGVMAGFSNNSESDDLSRRLGGVVNVPLISDTLGLRVSASRRNQAGQLDVIGDRVEDDVDSSEETSARGKLTWYATDALEISFSASRVELDLAGPKTGHFAIGTDVLNSQVVDNAGEDVQDLYTFSITHDLQWATLTSNTSLFEREYDYTTDSFAVFIIERFVGQLAIPAFPDGFGGFVPNPRYDPTFPPMPPWLSALGANITYASENSTQELRLVSNGDGPWSWVTGLYYKELHNVNGGSTPELIVYPAPGLEAFSTQMQALFPARQAYDDAQETSVYGNVDYQFNEQWNVGVGLRYSNVKTSREGDPLEIDENVSSVRFTLDYQPNDDVLAYFTTSTGFRPGLSNGTPQWYGVIPALEALGTANSLEEAAFMSARLSADGDQVTNYELGLKSRLLNDRVRLITSVYYIDWTDILLAVNYTHTLAPLPVNYSINGGDGHSQGIELSLAFDVTDNLTLSVTGDYNPEADLDDGVEPVNRSTIMIPPGTRLPNAPEYGYNVSADYQLEFGAFLAGARVDWAGVPSARYHLSTPHITPGYHRTNLRFTLRDQSGKWRAGLFAENLFDETIIYQVNPWGMTYAPGRQIGLEFSYVAGGI